MKEHISRPAARACRALACSLALGALGQGAARHQAVAALADAELHAVAQPARWRGEYKPASFLGSVTDRADQTSQMRRARG